MSETENTVLVVKHNDELLFKVPKSNKVLKYQHVRFLTVGGVILSLEILPPNGSRQVGQNTYIKVLSGSIIWTDSFNDGSNPLHLKRTFLCQPKHTSSLAIHSDDNKIAAEKEGALLIVFEIADNQQHSPNFHDIEQVAIENSLPEHLPEDVRKLEFKFIKVDELEWGKERFQGLKFYNMKGISIDFADNSEHLCYIQLWAAGTNVDAGVHNHRTDRFCEVHATLINGNVNSGMHYLKSSKDSYDPSATLDSDFIELIVPSFYEHGPLWDINENNEPVLREDGTVVYPWHKWQSGARFSSDDLSKHFLDIWIAFEFNANLAKLF